MKIRKLLIAVLSLVCIAATAAFAGCSIGALNLEETKQKFNLVATVNYYGNGGRFQNNSSVLTVYYKDGDKIINVGDTFLHSGTITLVRDNAELAEWYYATLDASGNPVFDSAEDRAVGRCQYDPSKKVEFPVTVKEGDNLHLVAGWKSNFEAKFYLADAVGGVAKGEELASIPFGTNGTVTVDNALISTLGEKLAGNTYVACFKDEECKIPVTTLSEGDYEEECSVFVKFLEGEWSVIKNGTDVVTMLREGDKKYYFYQDIDCASLSGEWQLQWQELSSFTGTLAGNGHKVTGLFIEGSPERGATYALFGTIGAAADISGITFDGLEISYTGLRLSSVNIYAFCAGYADGAKLKNITINATVTTQGDANVGAYPAWLTFADDIKVTVTAE